MKVCTGGWWREAGATAIDHVHDQVCSQVVVVPQWLGNAFPAAASSSGTGYAELGDLTWATFGSADTVVSGGSTSACTEAVVTDGREKVLFRAL